MPFAGNYPMLYAFFGADGGLDRDAMRRQVEHCLEVGVDGIAVLGLATEVNKLTLAEKRRVIDWTSSDVAGKRPLAVTVSGTTPEAQIELAQAALEAGAAWLILQPPPAASLTEGELLRFFGAIIDRLDAPVAIQNAPEYLGIGLGDEALATLARNHGNLRLLKGEASALSMRRTIEALDGQLAVFNGRGGIELPDNLRAGCAGIIPGAELAHVTTRIVACMREGTAEGEAEADRLYAGILPMLVFLMQSLDTMMCYGKRLLAQRLGLGAVHDRRPALAPSRFGLSLLARHEAALARLSS